jgi:hypothetical protein
VSQAAPRPRAPRTRPVPAWLQAAGPWHHFCCCPGGRRCCSRRRRWRRRRHRAACGRAEQDPPQVLDAPALVTAIHAHPATAITVRAARPQPKLLQHHLEDHVVVLAATAQPLQPRIALAGPRHSHQLPPAAEPTHALCTSNRRRRQQQNAHCS